MVCFGGYIKVSGRVEKKIKYVKLNERSWIKTSFQNSRAPAHIKIFLIMAEKNV